MDDIFAGISSDYAKSIYKNIEISNFKDEFVLGPYNQFQLLSDPKRVGFMFARYKFVAKMLDGHKNVLEIGCQEGLGTIIVAKSVEKIVAIDFYKPHIKSANKNIKKFVNNIDFLSHDIISEPVKNIFNAAYSLDVLEHIDPKQEDIYMRNILDSLTADGVLIIGTPSLESQVYASKESKKGHINCKSGKELVNFCKKYFKNVFIFGMNDEVLHTGFAPMCHYLLTLCVSPKR
jgi:2-polyprenyl-3-methyl-5-hydroxy-6-metoxy-1,4-benzoquinol methylase